MFFLWYKQKEELDFSKIDGNGRVWIEKVGGKAKLGEQGLGGGGYLEKGVAILCWGFLEILHNAT